MLALSPASSTRVMPFLTWSTRCWTEELPPTVRETEGGKENWPASRLHMYSTWATQHCTLLLVLTAPHCKLHTVPH